MSIKKKYLICLSAYNNFRQGYNVDHISGIKFNIPNRSYINLIHFWGVIINEDASDFPYRKYVVGGLFQAINHSSSILPTSPLIVAIAGEDIPIFYLTPLINRNRALIRQVLLRSWAGSLHARDHPRPSNEPRGSRDSR